MPLRQQPTSECDAAIRSRHARQPNKILLSPRSSIPPGCRICDYDTARTRYGNACLTPEVSKLAVCSEHPNRLGLSSPTLPLGCVLSKAFCLEFYSETRFGRYHDAAIFGLEWLANKDIPEWIGGDVKDD